MLQESMQMTRNRAELHKLNRITSYLKKKHIDLKSISQTRPSVYEITIKNVTLSREQVDALAIIDTFFYLKLSIDVQSDGFPEIVIIFNLAVIDATSIVRPLRK